MNLYDDLFPPQVFNANVKGHDEKGQRQNQLLPMSATLHLGHGFFFFLLDFTNLVRSTTFFYIKLKCGPYDVGQYMCTVGCAVFPLSSNQNSLSDCDICLRCYLDSGLRPTPGVSPLLLDTLHGPFILHYPSFIGIGPLQKQTFIRCSDKGSK